MNDKNIGFSATLTVECPSTRHWQRFRCFCHIWPTEPLLGPAGKDDCPVVTMAHSSEASSPSTGRPLSGWRSIQWWPGSIGLALAAFLAIDLFGGAEQGADFAAVVAASGLVYLAAASLEKPSISWPVFLLSVAIITIARRGLIPLEATWAMLVVALLFAAYGVVRASMRPNQDLPLQAAAMIAFGGSAALALFISPVAGALLVAGGLFAHAGWDVYHHVKNKVVVRSMAEFCFMLDSALGIAIVIATLRGG